MPSRSGLSLPPGSARGGRRLGLQASMFLVLAFITALAYWDEERESGAALDDFAAEQSTLASSLAAGLAAHLPTAQADAQASRGERVDPTEALAAVSIAVARIQH